jgi:hypothetical protein
VSCFYSFCVVSRSGCSPSWILSASTHVSWRFFFRIIFSLGFCFTERAVIFIFVFLLHSIPSSQPGSGLVPYRLVDLFTLTSFFGCSCSGPVSLIRCRGEGVLPGFIFAACAHQSGLYEILPPHHVGFSFHSCKCSLISHSGFSSRVCFLQSVLA